VALECDASFHVTHRIDDRSRAYGYDNVERDGAAGAADPPSSRLLFFSVRDLMIRLGYYGRTSAFMDRRDLTARSADGEARRSSAAQSLVFALDTMRTLLPGCCACCSQRT
jgi:hypothetical protein